MNAGLKIVATLGAVVLCLKALHADCAFSGAGVGAPGSVYAAWVALAGVVTWGVWS